MKVEFTQLMFLTGEHLVVCFLHDLRTELSGHERVYARLRGLRSFVEEQDQNSQINFCVPAVVALPAILSKDRLCKVQPSSVEQLDHAEEVEWGTSPRDGPFCHYPVGLATFRLMELKTRVDMNAIQCFVIS